LLAHELRSLVPDRALTIAPDLMLALRRHRWPGNIRQLVNALRTACALLDPDEAVIGWEHLSDDLARALQTPLAPEPGIPGESVEGTAANLRTVSRQAIERAVSACEGNLSEAARRLGISRNTLYRRLRD
jgi:sigma-54 dependent transcriptional regulator, acetoin dehydrogenase operon transcriptional activator AcoR